MALAIKTEEGWRLVGGPLSKAGPLPKTWLFPAAEGYDKQFIDFDGTDKRETGRWYGSEPDR